MGNVFLSFLGLGFFHQTTKQYDYNKTVFILNGVKSQETKFVQVAELEILGMDNFDKIVFNTPSACGGVIPLKLDPGLAPGFNTLY